MGVKNKKKGKKFQRHGGHGALEGKRRRSLNNVAVSLA